MGASGDSVRKEKVIAVAESNEVIPEMHPANPIIDAVFVDIVGLTRQHILPKGGKLHLATSHSSSAAGY